jgi:hypothetical protein
MSAWNKGYTDTQSSASYLELHLDINDGGRLKTKLHNKRDDFTFPIVNFSFISSNSIWSLHLKTHYSRACTQYSGFLDRAQPLTLKLLKQDYVVPMFKSSLQKFYGCRHELGDRSAIFISQKEIDLFHST